MIQVLEKTIEGSTYAVTQFPARRALRMKAKLLKMFGPALSSLLMGDSDKTEGFLAGMQNLVGNLNENDFENLCIELLCSTRKNGMELTAAIIDLEFAGDIGTLYQVLWFVIETNYANFFSLLGIGNLFEPSTQQTAIQPNMKKTFMRASKTN